jgi:hypothetical protein
MSKYECNLASGCCMISCEMNREVERRIRVYFFGADHQGNEIEPRSLSMGKRRNNI